MTAILLTAGPVASPVTVRRNGPRSLRSITMLQYESATQSLQRRSLGTPHNIKAPKTTKVFVKRPPDEIEDLLKNSDLCTPEQYRHRYFMPSPTRITQNMQDILAEIGLVPKEHFTKWESTGTATATVVGFHAEPTDVALGEGDEVEDEMDSSREVDTQFSEDLG